jgi:hypothetical protein
MAHDSQIVAYIVSVALMVKQGKCNSKNVGSCSPDSLYVGSIPTTYTLSPPRKKAGVELIKVKYECNCSI